MRFANWVNKYVAVLLVSRWRKTDVSKAHWLVRGRLLSTPHWDTPFNKRKLRHSGSAESGASQEATPFLLTPLPPTPPNTAASG